MIACGIGLRVEVAALAGTHNLSFDIRQEAPPAQCSEALQLSLEDGLVDNLDGIETVRRLFLCEANLGIRAWA